MKTISKFFVGVVVALFALTACEDDIKRENAPDLPDGCLGVYFLPADNSKNINKSAYEFEPTIENKIITISLGRLDTVAAAEVPLTILENTDGSLVIDTVAIFGANEATTTIEVDFSKILQAKEYKFKMEIKDDKNEFVNPYASNLPSFASSVILIKWDQVSEPAIVTDAAIIPAWYGVDPLPFYCYYETATLSGGGKKYRFLNMFSRAPENWIVSPEDDPDNAEALADANGIYDAYPYNFPTNVDLSDSYNIVMEETKEVKDGIILNPNAFELGMDWGYGMFSVVGVQGDFAKKNNKDPMYGTIKDNVITFAAGSLASVMSEIGGAFTAGNFVIYLTKEAYLDNQGIDDYNEVDYDDIIGEVSLFESVVGLKEDVSWDQLFQKAIDNKSTEDKPSDLKNLYYLPDLYATGYGLAFYINGEGEDKRIVIPSNQPTGTQFLKKDVYVSQSLEKKSSCVENNGIEEYTLGLSFYFEDGTSLGDFEEKFYFAEKAPVMDKSNFVGSFKMTGLSQFDDSDDAMDVEITEGGVSEDGTSDTLLISGVQYCSPILALYDNDENAMMIPPQELDAYNGFDITLKTTTAEGSSDVAPIKFFSNIFGTLKIADDSEADGYRLRSEAAGGWVDGYYGLEFKPQLQAQAVSTKEKTIRSVLGVKNSITLRAQTNNKCKLTVGKKMNRKQMRKVNNSNLMFVR